MQSSNSKLGFRGTENIGNDMKAIFQLEMGVEVSDGTGGSVLFSQETYVGLAGKFGTVRLGSMDTVYKRLGDKLSFFGITSGNFVSGSNILSKQPFGTGTQHRFHERKPNSMYYETPALGPFSVDVSYSLGEVADSFRDGTLLSAGVKYINGPLNVALAHEEHYNFFGASRNLPNSLSNTIGGTGSAKTGTPTPGASSTDTATRLTAQYRFTKNTRAEVNYAVTRLEETGGAVGRFASYQHNSWLVNLQHKIGAFTVQGSYGAANEGSCSRVGGAACSTAGLDGRMVAAGAYYAFSKRTGLFALYSRLRNGASATRSNATSDLGRPNNGQTVTQAAIGVDHSF
jgi:predicted porin